MKTMQRKACAYSGYGRCNSHLSLTSGSPTVTLILHVTGKQLMHTNLGKGYGSSNTFTGVSESVGTSEGKGNLRLNSPGPFSLWEVRIFSTHSQ